MKKVLFGTMIGALALVTVACFQLQGFLILNSLLTPGQATKVQFTLRPYSATDPDRNYQFILVGVQDTNDLFVGKATWGTNGKFGGPVTMNVSQAMAGAIATGNWCSTNGLDFGSITGIDWKAFVTPTKIRDRAAVDEHVIAQAVVKAKATAPAGQHIVMGVTGAWIDDGDDVAEPGDTFLCTGNATGVIYVEA